MQSYESILFYKFFPVADAALFRLWQLELCGRLGLKGRIIVSPHGINGTLAGERKAINKYLVACREWSPLGRFEVKRSRNLSEIPFPKLSVKSRDELVTFRWDGLQVDGEGVVDGGSHLAPEDLHGLLASHRQDEKEPLSEVIGRDVLFLDGRNGYEYEVGHFANSLDSKVSDAKGFIPLIESGELDEWKDRPVVTYCTGGIRCEILTPILKAHGFQDVYQIDGGIVKYLNESDNAMGIWEGSVYTFDTRMKVQDDLAAPIGSCGVCGTTWDVHKNCGACGKQALVCDSCWSEQELCSVCREG